MKIVEIILEASKAQQAAAKRAAADAKRAAAASAEQAEQERIAALLSKRKEQKMSAFMQPISATKKVQEPTGFLNLPGLEKYTIDPSIDPDFAGGYYLKFHTDLDGTNAYWSKGNLSYSQAEQFKNIKQLGRRFNPVEFQELLDKLISFSGKGAQPGYVHIEIDRRYLSNPFYTAMYSYLLKNYPTDEPTMNASVNWELV